MTQDIATQTSGFKVTVANTFLVPKHGKRLGNFVCACGVFLARSQKPTHIARLGTNNNVFDNSAHDIFRGDLNKHCISVLWEGRESGTFQYCVTASDKAETK